MSDQNWERMVIGTVLADQTQIAHANSLIPADFTSPGHKILWEVITNLYKKSSLSFNGVLETLRTLNALNGFEGGEDYLYTLMASSDSIAMKEAVEIIKEASVKRVLIDIGAGLAVAAKTPESSDKIIDDFQKQLLRAGRSTKKVIKPISEIVPVFKDRVTKIRTGEAVPAWIPNIAPLVEKIPFAEPSDFILVAGGPGDGKSTLLRHFAKGECQKGKKVLSFNMENDQVEYVRFTVAEMTGINSLRLRDTKKLQDFEVEKVMKAADEVAGWSWKIVSGHFSVTDIMRIAYKEYLENGIDIICVDYLQLIANSPDMSETENVMYSSRMLRGLGMELGVPIIVAAQFNREAGKNQDAKPNLQNILYAGERDATIVIGLWKVSLPEDFKGVFRENFDDEGMLLDKDNLNAVLIRPIVLKNRNGPVGVCGDLKWDKSTNRYYSLGRNWQQKIRERKTKQGDSVGIFADGEIQ